MALVLPPRVAEQGASGLASTTQLLGLIAAAESNNNPNAIYGGQTPNLTNMTVNQVRDMQRRIQDSGGASTAVGKYQIKDDTLDWLVGELGLSGDEKFTEELQDKLASKLLDRRGWGQFLANNMDEKAFMRSLSKEWASLPADEQGKSYYAGDGLNKALVSPEKTLNAIRSSKQPTAAKRAVVPEPEPEPEPEPQYQARSGGLILPPPTKSRGLILPDPDKRFEGRTMPGSQLQRYKAPGGTFVRGVERGIKQTEGLYGQFLREVGETTGLASLVEVGDEHVRESLIESLRNPPEYTDLSDVDWTSPGDIANFVTEKVGEQVANIALASVGGGLGGFVTKKLLTRSIMQKLAARATPLTAAKQAELVSRYTRRFGSGAGSGAAAGGFASFLPINTGEAIQEQVDAGLDPDLWSSLLVGIPMSALEIAGLGVTARAFGLFKGASKEAVATSMKQVLSRLGVRTLKSLAAEGGTESVQEAMVIASQRLKDPTFSVADAITSSEGLRRIAFAGVSGAAVGGVLGGAGAGTRAMSEASRIQRARIRTRELQDTINNELGAPEADQNGNVNSLFGFSVAAQRAKEKVTNVIASIATAVAARSNTELTPEEQEVANVAAHQATKEGIEYLETEQRLTDVAVGRIAQIRQQASEMLRNAQQILYGAETASELTAEQNEAVRKSRDRIKEVLDGLKGLSVEEQIKRLPKALQTIEEEVAKFLKEPLQVAAPRVRALIRATAKGIDNALNQKLEQADKYKKTLGFMIQRLQKAAAKQLQPANPEQTGPITTPQKDIWASIDSVATTGKRYAFAVGSTVNGVAKKIKDYVKKKGLVMWQDGDRVVISREDDMERSDKPAGDFVQDISQIDPEKAVVIRGIDKQGRVAHVEAVDRNDPEKVKQVVAKAKEAAGTGGDVQIAQTHEEVTRLIQERNSELSDLRTRTFTGVRIDDSNDIAKLVGNIGSPAVAARTEPTDSDEVVEQEEEALDLNPREMYAPTQEVEILVRIGVTNNDNRLMHAYLDGTLDEASTGDTFLKQEEGKRFRLFESREAAEKAIQNPDPRTAHKLQSLTELEVVEVTTPTGAKGYVIRGRLTDGRSAAVERQLRKALERGQRAEQKDQYIELKRSNGKKARFHAGEITILGLMVREFETGTSWFREDPRVLFLAGLSYIATQVEQNSTGELVYQYEIDFNPVAVVRDGKVVQEANPRDANLKILGNHRYKDLRPRGMYRSKPLYDKNGKPVSVEKRLRDFEKGDVDTLFEALMHAAMTDVGQFRKLTKALFEYGLMSAQEIAEWQYRVDRERSESGENKSLTDGIKLLWTNIQSNTETQELLVRPMDRSDPLVEKDQPEWHPGRQQQGLFQERGDRTVAEGARDIRTPEAREFEETGDITDEVQQSPSENAQEVQISTFAEDRTGVRSKDSSKPYGDTSSLRDRGLGFNQHAPQKNTGQVHNFISDWPAAQRALEFLLKQFNLKQKIVLFDEEALPMLIETYRLEETYPDNTAEQKALFRTYREALEGLQKNPKTGKIITAGIKGKPFGNSETTVHIFVSKDMSKAREGVTRAFVLGHELGHLLQYVYLDRLSPELRARVMADLGNDQEKFANYMAKVAMDVYYNVPVRPQGAVAQFFYELVDALHRLWGGLNKIFGKYPQSFNEFVAALTTHTSKQLGEQVQLPKTELALKIFRELEALEGSPYMPPAEAGAARPTPAAQKTTGRPTFDALPSATGERTMTYAGIGSRKTPPEAAKAMQKVASMLRKAGYTLLSGGAAGADSAFESAAGTQKDIFYAKDANDQTRKVAKEIHPAPSKLSGYVLNLMARNTFQIFGRNLDTPVDFVLTWTPDGAETHEQTSMKTGGTGQAIRMASLKGIPVINMAKPGWQQRLQDVLDSKSETKPAKPAKKTTTLRVERPTHITRGEVRNNPDKIYVFGDNDQRKGLGGQAKAMRGLPNSIGVRTKKAPNNNSGSFYLDEQFEENKKKIDQDFSRVLNAVRAGKTVVIPADGLGTGRARLGPRTLAYINKWISRIESEASESQIDVKEDNFPDVNMNTISDFFAQGMRRFKGERAQAEKSKRELIPEKDWWKNAPKGKKLDPADPVIRKLAEAHNIFHLLRDPETAAWGTRSRDIAERMIFTKLITRREFIEAALSSDKNADEEYMQGKITLGELQERDLRSKLFAIIDSRVTKGDFVTLLNSIRSKLPSQFDYAKQEYGYLRDPEPTSAEGKAEIKWRNRRTAEELFKDAELEFIEESLGIEGDERAAPMDLLQRAVEEFGYLSAKYRVNVSRAQLADLVEKSDLLKDENGEPEIFIIEDNFPDAEETATRAQDSALGNYVDDARKLGATFRDNPLQALKMLVQPADGELRSMGAIGTRIARYFRALPGSDEDSLTIFRRIQQHAAPFHNRLKSLLDTIPAARIPLREAIAQTLSRGRIQPSAATRQLQTQRKALMAALLKQTPPDQIQDPAIRQQVESIRQYLTSLHGWFTGTMGLKLGFRTDYFPMMLNVHRIAANRDEFVRIMREVGHFTEQEAQEIRAAMERDENGGLNNGFQTDEDGNAITTHQFFGPGMSSKAHRSRKWSNELRHALVDAGFYQEDLATVLVAYTEMAVRRGVWQSQFGLGEVTAETARRFSRLGLNPHSPVAKLQFLVETGYRNGQLNEWQRDRILNDILPAYAGQLGFKVNSKVRNINAWAVIYANLRVLSFAIFSQPVDIGTIFARGDWQAHKAGLKVLLNKATRDEAFQMLQAIGAIRQGVTEHILNDQALNTFFTGNAKRINDLFFHYNGMEGWTNIMRAVALMSARDFVQRNGQRAAAGDTVAIKRIKELGLTPNEAAAWDGHSLTDEKIKAALNRYIDEGMLRPDPSIRPVWMSDPGYMIFAHLKPFLWGFHEVFLRRVAREARYHQNLLPALTLLMVTLPLAAVGFELRRKITGRTGGPQGVDYGQELFERAGLFGIYQLLLDMEQADQYGKPMMVSLMGPTMEHMYDFLSTNDKDIVLAKSIPIVAQIPAAREWIKSKDILGD